jgi:hypothetical protein
MYGALNVRMFLKNLLDDVPVDYIAFIKDPIPKTLGPLNKESTMIGVCPYCSNAVAVIEPM